MKIIDLHKPFTGTPIYCGRAMPRCKVEIARRKSPLANPFKAKDHPDALAKYRRHLHDRLTGAYDTNVILAIRAIDENSVLACWCCDLEGEAIFDAPEVCHCQIIWQEWCRLKQSGQL